MENSNIEEYRRVNPVLADALSQFLLASQGVDTGSMTEDDKFKAAYALNLCTVSVSQIIDYNDVNFLEHEYEAILNNLNLEEMPKDEALLHILKQLLDVITYFRIQEGEKKLLEKEYQQKMKNAIWNAVPNIGLIVAGGNPVTMAVSLASQVGIGYMNYRKEKAKIGLEQERKEWELQRSAMEQFNGLRRELFDTAWRLAEKYKFPDEYRLTERQISQFNRILMDADDLRRYERLKYIEGKFGAYPPFWYYLGNAANAVCQNSAIYGEEIYTEYKAYAKESFDKFLNSTKRNLLREDQLEASCALELFDLLDESESSRKLELLERAQRASGNAPDVLELCAMSYWKIGKTEKAADLFRVLVNEEYNTLVNAQLLSKIYVSQAVLEMLPESRKHYQTLQVRVGAENLFPMPPDNSNGILLDDVFLDTQKDILSEQFVSALTEFIKKNNSEYEAICDSEGDISKEILDLLETMCNAVRKIAPDQAFVLPLQNSVRRQRKELQTMLICDKAKGQRKPAISFQSIAEEAFVQLAKHIRKRIDDMDSMFSISEAEMDLEQFCFENNLNKLQPRHRSKVLPLKTMNPIASALLDEKFQTQQSLANKADECASIVTRIVNSEPLFINSKKGNIYLYIRGDHYFDTYIRKNEKALLQCFNSLSHIIAIINDRGIWDQDLILSTESITLFEKKKNKGRLAYTEITQHYTSNGLQFGRYTFSNSSVNMSVLRKVTNELISVQGKDQNRASDNTKAIIQTVKNVILQLQESSLTAEESHKKFLDVLSQIGYNVSSVQNIRTSNKEATSTIKVLEQLTAPDIPFIQIHGKVVDGNPTKDSFCRLENQEGLYKIVKIGWRNDLKDCSAPGTKMTKFTLKKL